MNTLQVLVVRGAWRVGMWGRMVEGASSIEKG